MRIEILPHSAERLPFAHTGGTDFCPLAQGQMAGRAKDGVLIILIEPRGLWGMLRRVLGGDLIPVSHAAKPNFGVAPKNDPPR